MPRDHKPLPVMDVVICTLNSEHSIEACLAAVLREIPVNRIHVVDGGSSDSTLEKARRFDKVTVHIKPNLNLGQSRAFSFNLVETEHFVQIDSDVVLREGWGGVLAEHFGRADVLEFGTVDHWEFVNPSPETVKTKKYQARAFFFLNVIRAEATRGLMLDVRHMEEELTRRLMRKRGYTWYKTGIIHADHYTRPVRYEGRSISRLIRSRPFPSWVFYDQGKIDGLTNVSVARAALLSVKVMLQVLVGPFLWILGSIGNPFTAAAAYVRGYWVGRRGRSME